MLFLTKLYRWVSSRYHPLEQHVMVYFIYERVDDEGVTVQRWHRTTESTYFWPREVRALLEATGFEVEAFYGGWSDEPLTTNSTVQVWVARKAISGR